MQEFGCWTEALKQMAEWLKACRIDTVAMEATGVYWIALYDVLEPHGIRVGGCPVTDPCLLACGRRDAMPGGRPELVCV